jgi:peptidoglycan/LPS O-acetylase OafA/YrhL
MFVLVLFTRLQPWLLFCWIIGACGYLLVLAEDITPLFSLTGAVLAISGLIYSQYISAHPRSFGNFLSSGHVAEMIFSLGMAVVFAFVSKRVPHSKPMLRFERAGGKLAAFSYTLYLTHFPVVSLWSKFGPEKFAALSVHAFLWFIAECVACLLFAFVFYLPFEAQTARVRALLKRSAPGHNRAVKREEQLVRGPATAADLAQGEK